VTQVITVTNGSVSYKRNTRPADFENKEPAVTLSFQIDPGVDPEYATQYVMGIAFRTVELVHGSAFQPPQVQQPAHPTASAETAPSAPASAPVSDTVSNAAPVKRTRRTREQMEADAANKALDKAEDKNAPHVPADDSDLLGTAPGAKPAPTYEELYAIVARAVERLEAKNEPNTAIAQAIKLAGSTTGKLAGVPENNWPFLVEQCEKIGA
jgi:hypothetical protein